MLMSATLLAPSSECLVDQVEHAIQFRTGDRIRGLRIHFVDGCVVISGRTSTYYNKQLVTHAAMEVADDVLVLNEVEVC
jgi:hypothetical protein